MSQATPIQFIHLEANTPRSSEHNQYLVRSHVSKNNRRRKRIPREQDQERRTTEAKVMVPIERPVNRNEAVLNNASPHVLKVPYTEFPERRISEDSGGDSTNSITPASYTSIEQREPLPLSDLAPSPACCGAASASTSGALHDSSFGDGANYSKAPIRSSTWTYRLFGSC